MYATRDKKASFITMTNLSQIQNFVRINDHLAIGGQPGTRQLDLLKANNIEVVLQLCVDESPYSVDSERFHLNRLGIVHLSMNVSLYYPTQADVRHFSEFMDIYQGKNMFVHCSTGFGASNMVALYLMQREGKLLDEVRHLVVPGWEPTYNWRQIFNDFVPTQC